MKKCLYQNGKDTVKPSSKDGFQKFTLVILLLIVKDFLNVPPEYVPPV